MQNTSLFPKEFPETLSHDNSGRPAAPFARWPGWLVVYLNAVWIRPGAVVASRNNARQIKQIPNIWGSARACAETRQLLDSDAVLGPRGKTG